MFVLVLSRPGIKYNISSFTGYVFVLINTLRPGENGRHIADDISKLNFMNENFTEIGSHGSNQQ